MKKKNQTNQSDDSIDMFYGFWKYLGVFATFILGVILFWWGSNIILNDFFILRENIGPMAYIALAPLIFGAGLAWMSFSEFLTMIRNS